MRSLAFVVAVVAVGLLVSGCGDSGKLQTRGKVLKGGQPFSVPEDEYVRLTFIPVVEKGKHAEDLYVAEFNRADGTFKVAGKDLKGMPPGRYKIVLEHLKNRKDLLKGVFAQESTTPFACEVRSASDEVTIDLDQKKS
jgi:hypothetical protein